MRRVQFLLMVEGEKKHQLDVTVPDLPRVGDVFFFHEYADSPDDPWAVQTVFKDLWPGGHSLDAMEGPPLSEKGRPMYHQGDIVTVLLVPARA